MEERVKENEERDNRKRGRKKVIERAGSQDELEERNNIIEEMADGKRGMERGDEY
jgi:hypothetical protein